MNFEEKITTTYKEVNENSDASELKKWITTPSKRLRKTSEWVEKVWRDRCPTLRTTMLLVGHMAVLWGGGSLIIIVHIRLCW